MSKDTHGIVSREVLTKSWTDWIDYWAVDFNFESKREIIRVRDQKQARCPVWSSLNSWSCRNMKKSGRAITSLKTSGSRSAPRKTATLELTSVFHECTPGRRKLAVKVVDIFGNDTMTIVEVTVGGKK